MHLYDVNIISVCGVSAIFWHVYYVWIHCYFMFMRKAFTFSWSVYFYNTLIFQQRNILLRVGSVSDLKMLHV